MSISEQVKELREIAKNFKEWEYNRFYDEISEAADTIESLSAKLQAENMERSADCGGWIPCKEMLPEERQLVWVSVEYKSGDTESVEGIFINGKLCRMNGISLECIAKAWIPRYVPDPYHEP